MENPLSTQSCWRDAASTAWPALNTDVQTGVCIVGAGIAGLSVAYQLVLEGRQVIVVESDTVGSGETRRTTSHLTNAFDDRYQHVERMHGEDVSRIVAHSHTAAIDRIEDIIKSEGIECDFRRVPGYLFAPAGAEPAEIDQELAAAQRAGLKKVARVDSPPGMRVPVGPALEFGDQAQIEPLAYLHGLLKAFVARGGRVYEKTHVEDVEDGSPCRVRLTNGCVVSADAVVVASNTPINNRFLIHTKQAAYRTFVIGMAVPKGALPWALWWDTLDPYHYVRIAGELSNGQALLIAGGEDHKTGQADDAEERYARLTEWLRERFPVVGEPLYRWSGQVMEPADALAFIGRNPGDAHVYIATGDSGNGMTHGTIAGILLSDLIAGRDNPWRVAYEPARKPVGSLGEFARENLNVAAQYRAWLLAGGASELDEIAAGEGAVVRCGLHKIAAYRESSGALCMLDAACPHLGCAVEWNSNEKSWDCPCHGSRFDVLGRVLHGPAVSPLSRWEAD